MNHARLIATPALMLALGMAPGVVAGATHDPRFPIPMSDEPIAPVPAPLLTPTEACALEPAPVSPGTSYLWDSSEGFTSLYWRIPASACAACAGQGLAPSTVFFRVRWFGPCTVQADVSIVGAAGPAGCRVPNQDQVLCGPQSSPIVGVGSASTYHALPLPAGCCIAGDAFVRLRFTGFDACYPSGFNSPGLGATSTPCVACDEYITTVHAFPAVTDWCSIAQLSSLWVQLQTDCCSLVGVDPSPAGRSGGIAVLLGPSRPVRIALTLSGDGRRPVEVDAYDIAGRHVRTLLRAELEGGPHRLDWDGTSDHGTRLPAGVYKLRLRDGAAARAVATAVLLD